MDEGADSYWLASTVRPSFPAFSGKAQADVAIIGGGWVGLLAADRLKRAGRSVAVIESRHVAEQVTGHTTAKLTALHGLIYVHLVKSLGEEGARRYGEANLGAIEQVAAMARERGIDCDLERKAAYTFSESGVSLTAIDEEAETAARLGLPAAYVNELPLPFAVAGAVRFDHQAQFHPLKFIRAIAQSIAGDGCAVYEQTRALDVEYGRPHRVITDRGTVEARDVIIATNLPFPLRGAHYAKVFPFRHEVLAASLPPDQPVDGMFLRVDDPTFSLRTQRDGERTLLIAVGPSFKTGTADTREQQRLLEQYVRAHFGITEVAWRWGNQDYFSPDRVPLVGKQSRGSHRVYVATGFSAWGLTNGVVAAQILADHILEQANPYADLYDATRWHLRVSAMEMARENLQVARAWIGDRLRARRADQVCDVPRGEGAICKRGGEVVAVYKAETGETHYLSPRCSHLGCQVAWNRAERSWDCPCHGSRFSPEGVVLNGPAVRDLERHSPD